MSNNFLFNEEIKHKTVRLKNKDEMLGIFSIEDARAKALEMEMDLVMLTDKSTPPVVSLCNKSKFLYDLKKKQQQIKKNQNNVELQEIQLGLFIDKHDIDHKITKIKKILEKGNNVKLSIKLRRRYRSKQMEAKAVIENVISTLGNICKIQKEVTVDTHIVWCICVPEKHFVLKKS